MLLSNYLKIKKIKIQHLVGTYQIKKIINCMKIRILQKPTKYQKKV